MNIGLGFGPNESSRLILALSAKIENAGYRPAWGLAGFYQEFHERAARTFQALGCSTTLCLLEHDGVRSPEPRFCADLLRSLCQDAIDDGQTYVAVIFASEWEDDEALYRWGSPAELSTMLRTHGWESNHFKFGALGGHGRPFHVQGDDEIPLIFDVMDPAKPPSA